MLGDPLNEKTTLGPLSSPMQYRKVTALIQTGIDEGAKLICGGPERPADIDAGCYVPPTVFSQVSNDMTIAREEIFGPVLVAIKWKNEQDVIKMANDSHYGLAAYIWTKNLTKGINVANKVESGWIQINQGLGQVPGHSYGGFKQSGLGKEFSLEGMLDSYTQKKNITINLSLP